MKTSRDSAHRHQRRIDEHFDAKSRYWKELYEEDTLLGVIHQQRRELALQWVDGCRLPGGSRGIDVGCGAGVLAVSLARRGYVVDGIDTSQAMIELANQAVADAGVADTVHLRVGDAHNLPFPAGAYDLATSLGVLPFMHSPGAALSEMARVVKPGGYVLVSADNVLRLNHLLDPRYTPVFAPVRQAIKQLLITLGYRSSALPGWRCSLPSLRRLISGAGLTVVKYQTLGFGPFSILGWQPIPDHVGLSLHQRLQRKADTGFPVLASTGAQHLVLAQRASERIGQAT
jgi:ubiquinone/menaquinone biosynthesis C-methylase UbiE